jgi:uncharacterized protein YndB with AHSA1/START domain
MPEGSTKTIDLSTSDELVLSRVFDAPRELVWRAWTDPEHFTRWWGPTGFTTPHLSIDLRVGGVIHFCMRSPEGQDIWAGGVYQEIDPPARLVVTDYFADAAGNPVSPTVYGASEAFPAEALVTVTLEEVEGGKTRLTMRQTVPATAPERQGATMGWGESFDRLEAYLATATR